MSPQKRAKAEERTAVRRASIQRAKERYEALPEETRRSLQSGYESADDAARAVVRAGWGDVAPA